MERPVIDEQPSIEVLYVSSVPDSAEFERIKSRRRPGAQEVTYGMAEASFEFHTLVQRGLLSQGCRVHSLVGRFVSRRFYSGHYWRRRRSTPVPDLTVDHLGMPLYRGAKQTWLAASVAMQARRWERRTRGASRRIVLVDAAYVSVMPGVLWALRRTDVVALGLFADLYSYMADVHDASRRRVGLVHSAARRAVTMSLSMLDGYVVLTAQMGDVINREGKPCLVMEGLVDAQDSRPGSEAPDKSPHPTVLYAGALRKQYGLETLVRGFQAWDEPEAELVIYGQGDYAVDLAAIAEEDPRVSFRGPVPLADVVEAERRAWLLVNPRPADEEFTRVLLPLEEHGVSRVRLGGSHHASAGHAGGVPRLCADGRRSRERRNRRGVVESLRRGSRRADPAG